MFVDNKNKIIKIRDMKELKLLFSEAWKEAKRDPKEAILSVICLASICTFTYVGLWLAYIIGG